jgi:osmotically inducible protein OsmC
MAAFERNAQVVWNGGLADGQGTVSSGSGALADLPVTWAARVESPDGRTSPEELVAAAHAACYAMAFSNTLGTAGHPPEQLDVSAVVSGELGAGGLKVLSSELTVRGRVPGLDQSEFARLAEEGERSCPISNALRGNIEIRVNATLAD